MNTAWRELAACQDQDPALFHAGDENAVVDLQRTAAAKKVCAACPVRDVCLVDAISGPNPDHATVRGGLTATERLTRNQQPPPLASKLSTAEHVRRLAVATEVKDAGDAARLLGITRDCYKHWRNRYYTPTFTGTQQPALTSHQNEARLNLYNQGMSDQSIATLLGSTKSAIHRWRQRRNLPSNYNTQPNRKVNA